MIRVILLHIHSGKYTTTFPIVVFATLFADKVTPNFSLFPLTDLDLQEGWSLLGGHYLLACVFVCPRSVHIYMGCLLWLGTAAVIKGHFAKTKDSFLLQIPLYACQHI